MSLGMANAFSTYIGEESKGIWRFILCVSILLMLIQRGRSSSVVLKHEDICNRWETFQANCSKNEVIVINSARYGRIRTGKCVVIEENEQPCFTDVQQFLDKKCGGRRTCELTLPNQELDRIPSSCSTQRVTYLEISYYCQEVYTAQDQKCVANQPILVLSPTGYLANIITDGTGKGSSLCPWKFQLQPEQTINFTLLDFGIYGRTLIHDQESHCLIYAILRDGLSSSDWSGNLVCGADTRTTTLLMPTTKEVLIEVKKLNVRQNDEIYFLIKYDVVGCPEFIAPDGALADRIDNGYRVTCKDSSLGPWNVQCVAGKWTSTQNMSCIGPLQRITSDNDVLHLNHGLMIVIVLAVAIVISTIIIVFGIYLFQKRKSYSPPESLLESPGLDKHGNILYYTPAMGKRCLIPGGPDQPMTDLERDYATTLQMRQMVLPSAVMHPECIPSPGAGDLWMCPVHGVRTAGIATGNGSLSRRNPFAYKPRMEHIYEIPAAICEAEVSFPRNSGDAPSPESPFYHELDPNLPQFPNISRDVAEDLEPSSSSSSSPPQT